MRVGIGQDSHRFDFEDKEKKLVMGGVIFEGEYPLKGNSDADVVLHAITNAISGITCVNILGAIADKMCIEQGITDSAQYLAKALETLGDKKMTHLSLSIECARPKIMPKIPLMRSKLAALLGMEENSIGITATTGEGLTDFGRGEGVQCFAVLTVT